MRERRRRWELIVVGLGTQLADRAAELLGRATRLSVSRPRTELGPGRRLVDRASGRVDLLVLVQLAHCGGGCCCC